MGQTETSSGTSIYRQASAIDESSGKADGLLTAFSAAGIASWNIEAFVCSTGRVAAVDDSLSGNKGITTLTWHKWGISGRETRVGKSERHGDEEEKGVHDD